MSIIKIIIRCIKEKNDNIYIDESTILNINNNLKTYIFPGENIYSNIKEK